MVVTIRDARRSESYSACHAQLGWSRTRITFGRTRSCCCTLANAPADAAVSILSALQVAYTAPITAATWPSLRGVSARPRRDGERSSCASGTGREHEVAEVNRAFFDPGLLIRMCILET